MVVSRALAFGKYKYLSYCLFLEFIEQLYKTWSRFVILSSEEGNEIFPLTSKFSVLGAVNLNYEIF